MIDIAIATCASYPDLAEFDRGVVPELRELGIRARPLVWNDADADFGAVTAVVIQSTWDCHLHPAAFLEWARRVHLRTRLFNPIHLLEWNLSKTYLRILQDKGVDVTPTLWVEQGHSIDLRSELQRRGWSRIVIKPAISASANETYIHDQASLNAAQATLERLCVVGDVMVQPYLSAFETEGERSYVFFDNLLSHVVRRPPTLKSAHRSFAEAYLIDPVEHELRLAQQALAAIGDTPLYARVDVATNNDGVVRLQEVEMIEPSLFTSLSARARRRYAEAIARRLTSGAGR